MSTQTINTAELTDEQRDMALNLASWKNSLYEATMGDYTMESITRAERGRDAAEADLEGEGINPDHVVVWSDTRGCWTLA